MIDLLTDPVSAAAVLAGVTGWFGIDPPTCPTCDGRGRRPSNRNGIGTTFWPCPTCGDGGLGRGSGVASLPDGPVDCRIITTNEEPGWYSAGDWETRGLTIPPSGCVVAHATVEILPVVDCHTRRPDQCVLLFGYEHPPRLVAARYGNPNPWSYEHVDISPALPFGVWRPGCWAVHPTTITPRDPEPVQQRNEAGR